MAVSKATIVTDVWKLFYDRIKATVLTTTITGNKVVTIKVYDSAFADRPFDDNTYYPVIVINTPSVPVVRFTSGKDKVDGSILIEVYTNQSESADDFIAQVQDSIETYMPTLNQNGIHRVPNSELFGELQSDCIIRGSIKVHIRRLPIYFRYYYNRTINY
jgi:hypothetical protein